MDATIPSVFPGVRLPRQNRSRATFDLILGTAETLLREEGSDGVTVQAILARTGIGSGSFYARFDSHESLLRFMTLRFWAETSVGWASFLRIDHWKRASTAAVIHAFTGILVVWHTHFARELRGYLTVAMAEPEGRMLEEMTDLESTVADYLVDLISSRPVRTLTPPREARIRFATLQVFSTARSRIIFAQDETTAGITDRELARELARGFLLYIGAPTHD